MKNYGCPRSIAHDIETIFQDSTVIEECCKLCGKEFKWNKDYQGRVNNADYLEAHVRDFCQPYGKTAQLFYLLYHPELYEANRHLWTISICLNDECNRTGRCKHGKPKQDALTPNIKNKGTNHDK